MKNYRKLNFVIFHSRFTSSNFPLFKLKLIRPGQNLMTEISYEKWQSSLFSGIFSKKIIFLNKGKVDGLKKLLE